MIRLKKLNRIHGLELSVWDYRTFYDLDVLRVSGAEFSELIKGIKARDIMRLRLMHGSGLAQLVV